MGEFPNGEFKGKINEGEGMGMGRGLSRSEWLLPDFFQRFRLMPWRIGS
jgi:hypothetical protein